MRGRFIVCGCVALVSCHWIFPYEGRPPKQDVPAPEASLSDQRAIDRIGSSDQRLEPVDTRRGDLLPQCVPLCGGVFSVCCSKGGAPTCVASPSGCPCDPGTGIPCGGVFAICCDTGSGPTCAANATACLCDPSTNLPCEKDLAAPKCCKTATEKYQCQAFCP